MYQKCLAVAVILLFIGVALAPSINAFDDKQKVTGTNRAIIFGNYEGYSIYVDDDFDETTPGWNVTHFNEIRKGVISAEVNDSIFVYSGLYKEGHINVNRSMTFTGENKDTTIIDSDGYGYGFKLLPDGTISINGFTIQNARDSAWGAGMYVYSSGNIIFDNIIQNNRNVGIVLGQVKNNSVYNNIFRGNGINENLPSHYFQGGIDCSGACNNIIRKNIMENNKRGIGDRSGLNNYFIRNYIKNNTNEGIYIESSYGDIVLSNNIIMNGKGVFLEFSFGTVISRNNICNNSRNGDFNGILSCSIRNVWFRNYWGLIILPIKIILGNHFSIFPYSNKILPWIDFDLFPRRIPFLLGDMMVFYEKNKDKVK